MTSDLIRLVVAVIFVATLAVIVSNRSKTVDAINSFGQVFTGAIKQISRPI